MRRRGLSSYLILFVPVSFLMCLVHELGHVLLGLTMGGVLEYIKIGFLRIYPDLGLEQGFVVGRCVVSGLDTCFDRGVFLLAGSASTNALSWGTIPVLKRIKQGSDLWTTLNLVYLLGLLDLPLYILLPQLGLRHWVVVGGTRPEPLIGARLIGIPDPLFHLSTILITAMLLSVYSKVNDGAL